MCLGIGLSLLGQHLDMGAGRSGEGKKLANHDRPTNEPQENGRHEGEVSDASVDLPKDIGFSETKFHATTIGPQDRGNSQTSSLQGEALLTDEVRTDKVRTDKASAWQQ